MNGDFVSYITIDSFDTSLDDLKRRKNYNQNNHQQANCVKIDNTETNEITIDKNAISSTKKTITTQKFLRSNPNYSFTDRQEERFRFRVEARQRGGVMIGIPNREASSEIKYISIGHAIFEKLTQLEHENKLLGKNVNDDRQNTNVIEHKKRRNLPSAIKGKP